MIRHVLQVVSKHRLNFESLNSGVREKKESLNGDFWKLTSELLILSKFFCSNCHGKACMRTQHTRYVLVFFFIAHCCSSLTSFRAQHHRVHNHNVKVS
jgi:hypothetical protein